MIIGDSEKPLHRGQSEKGAAQTVSFCVIRKGVRPMWEVPGTWRKEAESTLRIGRTGFRHSR